MSEKSDKQEKKPKYTQLADEQLTWPHIFFQWCSIRFLAVYFRVKYDLHIHGREYQPKGMQSYIVACNHVASTDPPMMGVAVDFQPLSFMAKIELFDNFWMRNYNWWVGTFAVNRQKLELSSVKSALKVLKSGRWSLGIFPGGTRSKDGKMGEAKRGVAYFCQTAKVPVLPMSISHTPVAKGRERVDIRMGPMIQYDPAESMDELSLRIQNAITELIEASHPNLDSLSNSQSEGTSGQSSLSNKP